MSESLLLERLRFETDLLAARHERMASARKPARPQ